MVLNGAKKPWVNHYDVMGVNKDFTPRQLKQAFRKLSIKLHPDKNPDDPQAANKFQAMVASHNVLKDASERAKFDQLLKAKEIRFARDMAQTEKTRNMKAALEAAEKVAEDRARAAAAGRAARKKNANNASAKLARLRADGQRLRQQLQEDAKRSAMDAAKKRAVDAGILSPSPRSPSTPGKTSRDKEESVTCVTVKFKHRDQLSEGALRAKILDATARVRGEVIKVAQSAKKKRKMHVFLQSETAARCLVDRGIPGYPNISVEMTDKKQRANDRDGASKRDRGEPPHSTASAQSTVVGGDAKRPREVAAPLFRQGGDLASMETDIFAQLKRMQSPAPAKSTATAAAK